MSIRDAATIVLSRDSRTAGSTNEDDPRGIEVFMVRRNLNSDYVGGAYVFPGGAVDELDRSERAFSLCAGRDDREASQILEVEEGGLAFWVAAVRECFEEAGILLAYRTTPDLDLSHSFEPSGAGEASVMLKGKDQSKVASPYLLSDQLESWRKSLANGEIGFLDLCEREGLKIAADRIEYFSHWLTPKGAPRRYDTRFFVAAAPTEQVPSHDFSETVDSCWITPRDALRRHAEGSFDIIFPTIRHLEALAGFCCTADLLRAAAIRRHVPVICPKVVPVDDQGGIRLLIPGDPDYSEINDVDPPDEWFPKMRAGDLH